MHNKYYDISILPPLLTTCDHNCIKFNIAGVCEKNNGVKFLEEFLILQTLLLHCLCFSIAYTSMLFMLKH
uniref:Ovule protein n=1 Tax=Romanomermis culicivorax TaxID=13658 RepID=A0A915I4W7_ROMCU